MALLFPGLIGKSSLPEAIGNEQKWNYAFLRQRGEFTFGPHARRMPLRPWYSQFRKLHRELEHGVTEQRDKKNSFWSSHAHCVLLTRATVEAAKFDRHIL